MTHRSSHGSISADLNLISVHEPFEHTQDVFHLIARRSFELFEGRGGVHGNDREDWLLAESELLTPVKVHISESGDHLTARAEVPGFNSQEIKVSVEPHRLTISGKSELRKDHQSGKHTQAPGHERLLFCIIDLPAEVDLLKTKATVNDDTLEVVMPKAAPVKSVRVETAPRLPVEGDAPVRKAGAMEDAGSAPVVTVTHEETVRVRAASSRG